MKLFSPYLGYELEAEEFAAGRFLIRHEVLQAAIREREVRVTYQPFIIDSRSGRYSVLCTMTDGQTEVTEVGEVCRTTLKTQVSQEYPITMAQIRAHDRAALLLFKIASAKVFSDQETISNSALEDSVPEPDASTNEDDVTHRAEQPAYPVQGLKIKADDEILFGEFRTRTLEDILTKQELDTFLARAAANTASYSDSKVRKQARIVKEFAKKQMEA